MKQDFTFGGIIFTEKKNFRKVLLVKRFQFESWDLPKGHKEGDETDKEAALREVTEETGYRNIKLTGDVVTVSHEMENDGEKVMKNITFFLGLHEGKEKPQQRLEKDEIEKGGAEVKWVRLEEVFKFVTFAPYVSALEQAIEKW